jgi:microcystin-dependent protein
MSSVARLRRTGSQNKTNYYNNQLVAHFKPERGVIPELEEDMPAGTIVAFTGTVDPKGWLICDGRALEKHVFYKLYSVIDVQFGEPNPNTFRIPDLRGAFLRGAGTNATYTNYSGATDVNDFQEHATQVHHHEITDVSRNHTQTTINDDFNSSGGAYATVTGNNPPTDGRYQKPSYGVSDSSGSATWYNTINDRQTGITRTTDVMETDVLGTTVLTADKETRPFNLSINWIIKT